MATQQGFDSSNDLMTILKAAQLPKDQEDKILSQSGFDLSQSEQPSISKPTRANNIGNLRSSSTSFRSYATPEDGVADAARLLRSDYRNRNLFQIASKWAPKEDGNDPKRWSEVVSKYSGLPINQVPDLDDPATVSKLLRGISWIEKEDPRRFSDETIMRGVQSHFDGSYKGWNRGRGGASPTMSLQDSGTGMSRADRLAAAAGITDMEAKKVQKQQAALPQQDATMDTLDKMYQPGGATPNPNAKFLAQTFAQQNQPRRPEDYSVEELAQIAGIPMSKLKKIQPGLMQRAWTGMKDFAGNLKENAGITEGYDVIPQQEQAPTATTVTTPPVAAQPTAPADIPKPAKPQYEIGKPWRDSITHFLGQNNLDTSEENIQTVYGRIQGAPKVFKAPTISTAGLTGPGADPQMPEALPQAPTNQALQGKLRWAQNAKPIIQDARQDLQAVRGAQIDQRPPNDQSYMAAEADWPPFGEAPRIPQQLYEGTKQSIKSRIQGLGESLMAAARGTPDEMPLDSPRLQAKQGMTGIIEAEQKAYEQSGKWVNDLANKIELDPNYVNTNGFVEDLARGLPQQGINVLTYLATRGLVKAPLAIAERLLGRAIMTGAPEAAAVYASMTGMASELVGSQTQELKEKGVPEDRAFAAAVVSMAMQMPLERLGFGKILDGMGAATGQRLAGVITSFLTEGSTEYLQKYEEVAANIWAENPDASPGELALKFIDAIPQTHKEGLYEGLIGGVTGSMMTAGGQAMKAGIAGLRGPKIYDPDEVIPPTAPFQLPPPERGFTMRDAPEEKGFTIREKTENQLPPPSRDFILKEPGGPVPGRPELPGPEQYPMIEAPKTKLRKAPETYPRGQQYTAAQEYPVEVLQQNRPEPAYPERKETLQLQVNALEAGDIPVVMFPPETPKESMPPTPKGMRRWVVSGDVPGAGVYYFNPKAISRKEVQEAAQSGQHYTLLGIVQNKQEAMANGQPMALQAVEPETRVPLQDVVVDGTNQQAIEQQVRSLQGRWPNAMIQARQPGDVISERMAGQRVEQQAQEQAPIRPQAYRTTPTPQAGQARPMEVGKKSFEQTLMERNREKGKEWGFTENNDSFEVENIPLPNPKGREVSRNMIQIGKAPNGKFTAATSITYGTGEGGSGPLTVWGKQYNSRKEAVLGSIEDIRKRTEDYESRGERSGSTKTHINQLYKVLDDLEAGIRSEKTAPEMIATTPAPVMRPQKEVDMETVNGLRAELEARKAQQGTQGQGTQQVQQAQQQPLASPPPIRPEPGTAAANITDNTLVNSETMGEVEQRILAGNKGIREELGKIRDARVQAEGEAGINTFKDWMNPAKVGSRIYQELRKQGMDHKTARERLGDLMDDYEWKYKEVLEGGGEKTVEQKTQPEPASEPKSKPKAPSYIELPESTKAKQQSSPQTSSPSREEVVSMLKSAESDLIGGQGPVLKQVGSEYSRLGSGNPEWFVGNGWTKRETYKAIDKAINGDKLTPKQQDIINSIIESKTKEYEVMYGYGRDKETGAGRSDAAGGSQHNAPRKGREEVLRERQLDALRSAAESINESLGRAAQQGGRFDLAKASTEEHLLVRAIHTAQGRTTVFWETSDPVLNGINGFTDPEIPDHIFLNVNAGAPLFNVGFHETMHLMEGHYPDVYDLLLDLKDDAVGYDAYVKNLERIYGDYGGTLNGVDTYAEFAADFLGDQMRSKEFMDLMKREHPEVFAGLELEVSRLFYGRKGQLWKGQYFSDMDAARKNLGQALAEYTQRSKALKAGEKQQESASVKESAPTKIEDFGEKLGGARKDNISSLQKEFSDEEIASKSFSEIWPKSEVDSIEDKSQAAFATAIRSMVPSKPRKPYLVKRWVESVKMVRTIMDHAERLGKDALLAKMKDPKYSQTLDQLVNKVQLLESIDRSQWGRIGDVEFHPNAYAYEKDTNKQIPSPFASAEIDATKERTTRVRATNMDELIKKVNTYLSGDKPQSKIKFEVRGRGERWAINKVGDPLYQKLKTFTSSEEALNYRNTNHEDLVQAWEMVKESDNVKQTDVRREENRLRVGGDYRNGKPATPEMFSSAFGFRGVEFGNWVKQGINAKDRQGMLDQAYDALMDLSKIIGIPSNAISLNGTLGLGFGSRGSGWASAHFEPDTLVINLTKPRGAGSMAHEWFHALDNYFQRARGSALVGNAGDYITQNPETYYQHAGIKTRLPESRFEELKARNAVRNPSEWTKVEGVRPQVAEAFTTLVKALNDSPMAKRSALIDKGKSGGYWGRIIERGARAFENYVIAKMQEQGYHNDYLANVTSIEEFQRDPGRYPYLLDDELKPVAKAFDDLFGTIESKPSKEKQGASVLFSLSDRRGSGDQQQPAVDKHAPFYSQMQQVIGQKLPESGLPAQYVATIKGWADKGEFKRDELEWSGLIDWLKAKRGEGRVSKADVLKYLDENKVEIKEVIKGKTGPPKFEYLVDSSEGTWSTSDYDKAEMAYENGDRVRVIDPESGETLSQTSDNLALFMARDEAYSSYMESPEGPGDTKFSQYTLPGGENYREMLLTLPERGKAEAPSFMEWYDRTHIKPYEDLTLREQRIVSERYQRESGALAENKSTYTSSHWDEPNVLTHVRMNDRTDVDGKKVLFIEEIQSDWMQEGRKKGYDSDEKKRKAEERVRAAEANYQDVLKRIEAQFEEKAGKLLQKEPSFKFRLTWLDKAEIVDMQQEYSAAVQERNSADYSLNQVGFVPNAPFKTTWPLLAFKRMIRFASENGYDRIAWTTGEQQIERYWGNETISAAVDRFHEVTKPQSIWKLSNNIFGRKLSGMMSFDIVDGGVLSSLQNDKVKRVVVSNLPVDVVDILAVEHLSPNQIFSDPDMVVDRLSIDGGRRVADGIVSSIKNTGASIRAKLSGLRLGGGEIKLFPALKASDLSSSEMAGIIAPSAIFHLGTDSSPEKAASTGATAKSLSPEERLIFGDKFSPAKLAELLNAHIEIIHGHEGIVKQGFESPSHEGMKGFYDKILPSEVNKYVKKWGAKVGETKIEATDGLTSLQKYVGPEYSADEIKGLIEKAYQDNTPVMFRQQLRAVEYKVRHGETFASAMEKAGSEGLAKYLGGKMEIIKGSIPVHSIDVTDAMRKSAMKGQPLFSLSDRKAPKEEQKLKVRGEPNISNIDSNENLYVYLSDINSKPMIERMGRERLVSKNGPIEQTRGQYGGSWRFLYRDDSGKIVAALQGVRVEGQNILSNAYVRPDYRGKGIGTNLLDTAKEKFRGNLVVDNNLSRDAVRWLKIGGEGVKFSLSDRSKKLAKDESGAVRNPFISTKGTPKERAKDEIKATLEAAKEWMHPKDATFAESVFRTLDYMNHPAEKAVFEASEAREERKHEIFLKHKEALDKLVALRKSDPKQYDLVSKLIDWMDVNEISWDRVSPASKAKFSEKAIDAVDTMRQHYDEMLELMRDEVKTVIDFLDQQKQKPGGEEEASITVPLGDGRTKSFKRSELQQLYQQMGELKGSYAPRIREPGDYYLRAKDADGNFYRFHKPSIRQVKKLQRQLARNGFTDFESGPIAKLPDEIYQGLKLVDVEKFLEHAINQAVEDPATKASIRGEALLAAANMMKARAFRAHKISRSGRQGNVVRGFIQDPAQRYGLYLSQLAGGIAKAEAGQKMVDALRMIDPTEGQQKRYSRLKTIIAEQMRNSDRWDRMIGFGKSIVSLKYLGFNPRSALVNVTAQVTTVPPAILRYALGNKGSLAAINYQLGKAGKDYSAFMLGRELKNEDEQSFMAEMKRKGIDAPQLVRDATREINDGIGNAWSKFMEKAMWMFAKTEQWNRGTTLLAAYRLARKQGQPHDQAMESAQKATERGHGVYTKATMPTWAMGDNPFAKIAQTGYTFQKFTHNYLQMLYDHGLSKKSAKGLAYALIAPAVVGGATASPLFVASMLIAKAIMRSMGDDREPEKMVHDTIRDQFGEDGEISSRYGVIGMTGVDISGSLGIGIGFPRDLVDLTGPFGGVAKDISNAFKYAGTQQYSKAAERLLPTALANPFRAVREMDAVTTSSGNMVWNDEGKPYKPTATETAQRITGFRSSKRALTEERQFEAKREAANFSASKAKIYDRYEAWVAGGKQNQERRQEIMDQVDEFNQKVKDSGREGAVPLITKQSLRGIERRMEKPGKRERAVMEGYQPDETEQKREFKKGLVDEGRSGDRQAMAKDLLKSIEEGTLSTREAKQIWADAQLTEEQSSFKRTPMQSAAEKYLKMDEAERDAVAMIYMKKLKNYQQYDPQAFKKLMPTLRDNGVLNDLLRRIDRAPAKKAMNQ